MLSLCLENLKHLVKITFPISEHPALIQRLKNNQQIITTRVSDEFNKYHVGNIVKSDLNYNLKVLKIKSFKNIKNHPYFNELNKNQISIIQKYPQFQVIWLKKQNK